VALFEGEQLPAQRQKIIERIGIPPGQFQQSHERGSMAAGHRVNPGLLD
jgi:hypothetical protein